MSTTNQLDGIKIYDADSKTIQGGNLNNSKSSIDCGNDKIKGIYGTFKTSYDQQSASRIYTPYIHSIDAAICTNS
jgi:hypothetical protein